MKQRLSVRLFVLSMALSLLLATVFFFFFRNILIRDAKQSFRDTVRGNLTAIDLFLDEYIRQKIYDVEVLAASRTLQENFDAPLPDYLTTRTEGAPPPETPASRRIQAVLAAYQEIHPRISNVYFGRNDGAFVSDSPLPISYDAVYDPRSRPWYLPTLDAGGTVIHRPYMNFEGDSALLTVSTPVRDGEGRSVGIIALDILTSRTVDFLKIWDLPAGGEAGYYLEGGLVVRIVNTASLDSYDETPQQLEESLVFEEVFLGSPPAWLETAGDAEKNDFVLLEIEGRTNMVMAIENSEAGRIVYYRLPYDWLINRIRPLIRFPLGVVIGSMLLLSAAVLVIGQYLIVRPVRHMATRVADMGPADDNPIPEDPSYRDELKILRNAIVDQYNELRQYRENLEQQVTERTLELRESLEKLRIIADYGYDLECWVDPDEKLIWINPAVTRMTGYTVEECYAMDQFPGRIVPGYTGSHNIPRMILDGRDTGEMTVHMEHKDGTSFWASVTWRGIRREDGTFLGARVNARDVTRVTEMNQMFATLMNNIRDFLFIMGPDQRFRAVSRPMAELLGVRSPEEIADAGYESIMPPEQAQHYRDMEKKALMGQEFLNVEEKQVLNDGEERWIRVSLLPLRNPEGGVESLLGTFYDITAARRSQERLAEAKILAEEAARLKSDFLANMSHEIRTPMNAVIGLGHLLSRTNLDVRQKDYVTKIDRSAKNLLGIINDILDFSKIEAGKMTIETVPFSLEEIINDAYATVSGKIREKGLEFVLDLDPRMPFRVIGDPLRLSQILINLTSNAVKYTEKGTVTLATGLRNETDEAVHLEFSIADTGIGIAEGKINGLFDAFSQADSSTTRHYGGTGLGLSIVRRLVELMGGELGADSTPGEGSRFWFRLWLKRQDEDSAGSLYEVPMEMEGMRVLVVDDDPSDVRILKRYLEDFSFDVDSVDNGGQALSAIRKAEDEDKPYQTVFLDWQMPVLNGIRTAEKIIGLGLRDLPRLIMISAYGRDSTMKRAELAGIDAFLVKPLSQSNLFDVIQEVHGYFVLKGINSSLAGGLSSLQQKSLEGRRILLVEDNPINRDVAREILAGEGLVVEEAVDGREAVETVRGDSDGEIDLVLMDLQMPVLDGFGAAREIRQLPDRGYIPIIALTADLVGNVRDRISEAGMDGIISKPINLQELFQVLAENLGVDDGTEESDIAESGSPTSGPGRIREERIDVPDTPDIPDISGIETRTAVERLGGKVESYRKLLARFVERYGDDADAFSIDIGPGQRAELGARAHALKGVAANLGVEKVRAAAGILEAGLEDDAWDAAEAAAELKNVLKEATGNIAAYLGDSEVEEVPEERAGTEDFWSSPDRARLEKLLESGDLESVDLVETWTERTRSGVNSDRFREIRAYVLDYDFKAALSVLRSVES